MEDLNRAPKRKVNPRRSLRPHTVFDGEIILALLPNNLGSRITSIIGRKSGDCKSFYCEFTPFGKKHKKECLGAGVAAGATVKGRAGFPLSTGDSGFSLGPMPRLG